ncbi:MAG: protein kinase [Proteobacteria bacterium]|nr:protein kinase [Pseudomonadota bacterium]
MKKEIILASKDELGVGTVLKSGRYTIQSIIGLNNFGIKYSAVGADGDDVVLKEFFPSEICVRDGLDVTIISNESIAEFKDLIGGFLKDAGKLVALDNPNIGTILEVFEENNTAYMVEEVVNGVSLLDAVNNQDSALTPDRISEILMQLLLALHDIHALGLLHRNIEPQNITLTKDYEPTLFVDFGTFRDKPSRESRAFSKLASNASKFAPMEMSIESGDQTPSADIYCLAASIYYAIIGNPPVSNIRRISEIAHGDSDPYVNLAGQKTGYKQGFLEALDIALAPFPRDRIKSATEWLRYLDVGQIKEITAETKSLFRPDKITETYWKIPRSIIRPTIAVTMMVGALFFFLSLIVSNA